ncbi:DUF1439 domain-containing protein [Pseudoalteromonas ulvae]|uniref:DUF1439 domain-containing protein n=1 Tax=Pseudoalteromonas ulvae TaxID=107327 RepID=A0A244CLE3_PSEDV|nr:DUF1439 domain-containing protein [Pseudoalteromonas ulvae]OUL56414.1 hypothetical protein B1199_17240 [Pseudoalteromonas ulvae]
MVKYIKANVVFVILLVWIGSLTGCSSLNSLALYQISEQTINQQTAAQLSSLAAEHHVMGIPVTLGVTQALFTVGPDGKDVVRLTVKAQANIKMFGLRYPVLLHSSLEAKPVYRGQDHSIYLQQLTILHSSIEAAGFKGNLKPLDDNLQALISQFLAANPIYTLNEQNPTERLLMSVPVDIKIKAGLVELTPSLH